MHNPAAIQSFRDPDGILFRIQREGDPFQEFLDGADWTSDMGKTKIFSTEWEAKQELRWLLIQSPEKSYSHTFEEKLNEALMGQPSGWQSRRRPNIKSGGKTTPKIGRPIRKSGDSSKAGAGHYY